MRSPLFTFFFAIACFALGPFSFAQAQYIEVPDQEIPERVPQDYELPEYETYSREYFSFHLFGNRLPECTSWWVRRSVKAQIWRANSSYYDDRTIDEIAEVVETGYRLGQPSPSARRYCAGIATLNDGTVVPLFYRIMENDGFLGIGWGVQACLQGLDKYHVADGNCRTVRPPIAR